MPVVDGNDMQEILHSEFTSGSSEYRIDQLRQEIKDSGMAAILIPGPKGFDARLDRVALNFNAQVTGADVTALEGVISAHTATGLDRGGNEESTEHRTGVVSIGAGFLGFGFAGNLTNVITLDSQRFAHAPGRVVRIWARIQSGASRTVGIEVHVNGLLSESVSKTLSDSWLLYDFSSANFVQGDTVAVKITGLTLLVDRFAAKVIWCFH